MTMGAEGTEAEVGMVVVMEGAEVGAGSEVGEAVALASAGRLMVIKSAVPILIWITAVGHTTFLIEVLCGFSVEFRRQHGEVGFVTALLGRTATTLYDYILACHPASQVSIPSHASNSNLTKSPIQMSPSVMTNPKSYNRTYALSEKTTSHGRKR